MTRYTIDVHVEYCPKREIYFIGFCDVFEHPVGEYESEKEAQQAAMQMMGCIVDSAGIPIRK
jgi:hypothetical protein